MKEKKKKRRGLGAFIAILWVLLIALVIGYCVLMYVDGNTPEEEKDMMFFGSSETSASLEDIAEEDSDVSFDKGDSVLYINNELIVLADIDAELSDLEDIAERYGAEISDTMEGLGIYQLRFPDSVSLSKLEEIAESISAEEGIESAYVNPVIIFETDDGTSAEAIDTEAADEDEKDGEKDEEKLEYPEAVYPEDPWEDVDWNINIPAGDNWGLEAINAPVAWGWLDELETSKVGLIDSTPHLDHEDLKFSGAYFSFYELGEGKWYVQDVNLDDYPAYDSHGTHVSGIMGAQWNETGVSGILGNNSELYYADSFRVKDNRVIDDYDTAYTFIQSIVTLLEKDVTAINISRNTSRVRGFAASQGNKDAIASLEREAEVAGALLERIVRVRQSEGRPDFVICVAAGNINGNYFVADENADFGYIMYDSRQRGSVRGGDGADYAEAKYNNFLNLIKNESVASRIIVVGAAQIDGSASKGKETAYKYTYFSCTGDRVDICAPGVDIYSTVDEKGKSYDYYDGTSMATPHVTAAAGMIFAANPELTGPEVKKILIASASGRYYFDDGNCGLLDLANAVRMGIESREESVNRVIGAGGAGLDLCFLVDTTGSMDDDIDNAKENMIKILDSLAEKTEDYRVALVDYRDFPDRSYSYDYPAKIQLHFTNDKDSIIDAINGLDLGNGGDEKETVYSGFAETLKLDWRSTSSKVIIVLGDAPPLDPEPYTGYTYESVLKALYDADVMIDVDSSDEEPIGDAEDSLIKIYGIGTSASSDAAGFLESISAATGGTYKDVEDASGVSDAIVDSIEEIELEPVQTVKVSFGEEFSKEKVNLFYDGELLFSFELDEDGNAKLDDMKVDKYEWEIERLRRTGKLSVKEGKSKATAEADEAPWYGFAFVLWERQRNETFFYTGAGLLALILVFTVINLILGIVDSARAKKEAAAAAVAQPQYPYPPYPYGMYNGGAPYQQPPMQYPNGYPVQQDIPMNTQMQYAQPVQEPVPPVRQYEQPAYTAPVETVEPVAPIETASAPTEPVTSIEPEETHVEESAVEEAAVENEASKKAEEAISPEAPKKKFCYNCGQQLDADAKFCFNCGQKL